MANALIDVSEAVAAPIRWGATKRYEFRLLPVGDAFLVWSKTSRPWIETWSAAGLPRIVEEWWRLPLHGASLLITVSAWLLTHRLRTYRRELHSIPRCAQGGRLRTARSGSGVACYGCCWCARRRLKTATHPTPHFVLWHRMVWCEIKRVLAGAPLFCVKLCTRNTVVFSPDLA